MSTAQVRPRSLRHCRKEGRETVSGIGKDTVEANTGSPNPVDLGERDLALGPIRPQLLLHPAGSMRTASLVVGFIQIDSDFQNRVTHKSIGTDSAGKGRGSA
jgi:hypothetical protein